ncbi:hypothetical protein ACLB2K_029132 [Fragaria x ananassa]
MQHLALGLLPRSMLFSQSCSHIRTLSICINMTNPDQMLANGEELSLAVAPELSGWMDTLSGCMFNQLCVIMLKNVTDLNVEREYIRLLLLCTPVLQCITLVQGWECCCSIRQWLVSCDRASIDADIVCQDLCATNVSLGAHNPLLVLSL